MSRRVNLPAADDLFGATSPKAGRASQESTSAGEGSGATTSSTKRVHGRTATAPIAAVPDHTKSTSRRTSGRVRHDEKMTVYVTAEELLHLEAARLRLRSEQGIAVDRGRLVREAIGLVLEDLETNGAESGLVRRLMDQ